MSVLPPGQKKTQKETIITTGYETEIIDEHSGFLTIFIHVRSLNVPKFVRTSVIEIFKSQPATASLPKISLKRHKSGSHLVKISKSNNCCSIHCIARKSGTH